MKIYRFPKKLGVMGLGERTSWEREGMMSFGNKLSDENYMFLVFLYVSFYLLTSFFLLQLQMQKYPGSVFMEIK